MELDFLENFSIFQNEKFCGTTFSVFLWKKASDYIQSMKFFIFKIDFFQKDMLERSKYVLSPLNHSQLFIDNIPFYLTKTLFLICYTFQNNKIYRKLHSKDVPVFCSKKIKMRSNWGVFWNFVPKDFTAENFWNFFSKLLLLTNNLKCFSKLFNK